MYQNFIKVTLDTITAFIVLILLSPIFIIISLVQALSNKGNVFFTQIRPGKHEKPFKLIKFKTMTDKTNHDGELLPDQKRLTKLGMFLRKTSLDELPQLVNVFKGDMSFVGPRPLLVEYLPLYSKEQRVRHSIKPGITGWAQVNGRNAISWEEKFKLDSWYVKHKSFLLDLKILVLTFLKIIQSKDVNKKNTATTTKFKGNNL
ncbi:sugar transferase [Psychroflexus montanilacus]|uniref:sugar transferase n=1 Tax=Psychroflexus montanilacus TaxID=2873598 RepID=UPI001CCA96F9|nr:sugar transferase [Psychroflexus montanilacus]MBZ9652563.1 sugar transferase [Psychroflexus montanilacus]